MIHLDTTQQHTNPLADTSSEGDGLFKYEEVLSHLHPDFAKHLLERAPNLTPMEIRVCNLTRLHFRTKEAASILAVTKSSIETHRYHARAKLKVDRRQNFSSILHTI